MARRTRKSARSGGPPPRRRRTGRRLLRWSLVCVLWALLGFGGLLAWYAWDLPDVGSLDTGARRPSMTILAADGALLAQRGDLYGAPARFADLPPHLVQAVVAIEDRRFFDHSGFDPWGLARAAFANLRAGSIRQGGSTITQQLAKNLFLTHARTLRRKVQELLVALWLEAEFTKRQIFTIYANRVYLGAGAYGVAAAAQRYFGKPVGRLDLLEAAVLAGLLKAPSRYAPTRDPEAAKRRARRVLRAMVDAGFLTEEAARRALRGKLRIVPRTGVSGRYFVDWVLDRAADYIGHADRDLIVVTTLDVRLQRAAEQRLRATLARYGPARRASQAALVALAPDGAVRAMVGGRSFAESQFNRVTQALRQPGSAFKLFVYLAGLEAGIGPRDRIVDGPVSVGGWRPRNYDGRFRGPVELRTAFAHSLNSVAVRVAERAGRGNVAAAARRLGITSKLAAHPSAALGAGEVTLLELTAAYAALANRGRAAWPHGIVEIRDKTGRALYRRAGPGGGRVVDARHVVSLDEMLAAVITEGTGRAAALGWPAAGKTGTSQDFRDAWFVGYTADLVAGVWVGNDDGRPMKRVTGGGLPARLWRAFMRDAHRSRPASSLDRPGPRPPAAGGNQGIGD